MEPFKPRGGEPKPLELVQDWFKTNQTMIMCGADNSKEDDGEWVVKSIENKSDCQVKIVLERCK